MVACPILLPADPSHKPYFYEPVLPPAAKIHIMFWHTDGRGNLKCRVVWSDGEERLFDWFTQSRAILNIQHQFVEEQHAEETTGKIWAAGGREGGS